MTHQRQTGRTFGRANAERASRRVVACFLAVLCAPGAAQAIVIGGAKDATVGITTDWKGVGLLNGNCTGTLIDAQHVLSAAHCFFNSDGMGPQLIAGNAATFVLPEIPGTVFMASRVDFMPGFVDPTTMMGRGHRVVGLDLAVVTLATPLTPAQLAMTRTYTINAGQIPDERVPTLDTFIVGFGQAGDGVNSFGIFSSGVKRVGNNRVDEYGDGTTTWTCSGDRTKDGKIDPPPPPNTLVFDFDRTTEPNSTGLVNHYDQELNGFVANEAMLASGDSGGPMFQLTADGTPILVGVASSGSDSQSKYASIGYETKVNVPAYLTFIATVPEPPVWLLGGLAGAVALVARAGRRSFVGSSLVEEREDSHQLVF
jgi:hypothetical protein